MLGTINKKYEIGTVLEKLKYVSELYSDVNFTFEKDGGEFIMLCSQNVSLPTAYFEFSRVFPLPVRLYVTKDPFDAILCDKRIVWRKGVWYV